MQTTDAGKIKENGLMKGKVVLLFPVPLAAAFQSAYASADGVSFSADFDNALPPLGAVFGSAVIEGNGGLGGIVRVLFRDKRAARHSVEAFTMSADCF